MIVVDASVFVKLLKEEEGSSLARSLVDRLLEQREDERYLAPSILLYEALSAALHVELPLEKVGSLLDGFREFGLAIEDPSTAELALAEKIARSEAPGGGHPALFDSIYHAMAIARGGTLVTSDERHFRKAEHYGNVVLLSKWRPE